MDLYHLNNLVNTIASNLRNPRTDCLYLNELLYEAELAGYQIEIDRKNKQYIITKGDDKHDSSGRL